MKQSAINLLSIIFLGWLTYLVFYYSGADGGLNWWGEIFPYGQFLSTVVLMLVGIAFGCLFRQIRDKGDGISIRLELVHMWQSSSFWSAILVSPLVFGGVFLLEKKIHLEKPLYF